MASAKFAKAGARVADQIDGPMEGVDGANGVAIDDGDDRLAMVFLELAIVLLDADLFDELARSVGLSQLIGLPLHR